MQTELGTIKRPDLAPRLSWQQWTRENLPKDIFISDIDGVIRSRNGDMAIIELKGYGGKWTTAQSITIQILHKALKQLHGKRITVKMGDKQIPVKVKYHGVYLISWQGDEADFSTGVTVNGKPSTEKEVARILSFKKR